MQTTSRSERTTAFTLTELLVVMATAALLLLLALPALARDKNRAHDAIDQSNFMQIMQAMHSFAADNSDFLPRPGWGLGESCWLHGADLPSSSTYRLAGYGAILAQQQQSVTNGQLYPYLHSFAVFMCPADKPDNLFFYRNIYVTSYFWNGAVRGYGSGPPTSGSYKLSQFKPDRVLQWEADERIPFYFNDAASYPDEGATQRHDSIVTLGLFSGGTEKIPFSMFYTSEFAGAQFSRGGSIPASLLPNRMWCNPGVANGQQ